MMPIDVKAIDVMETASLGRMEETDIPRKASKNCKFSWSMVPRRSGLSAI